jgi:sarcosine oxidase
VIVGAGTFGAALARLLARDGVAVTIVDQFEPGDERATSGGEPPPARYALGARVPGRSVRTAGGSRSP